ncbi:hypothetical protein OIB37_01910 [Streptomyces sp. NBC_00820]|nr:hypothetical protein OIB37_01910 [Streptomyces sp. NBC_00820]
MLRQLLRAKEGRHAEPSACVIDTRSVPTSTGVPTSTSVPAAGTSLLNQVAAEHPGIREV